VVHDAVVVIIINIRGGGEKVMLLFATRHFILVAASGFRGLARGT
jgi:hypothetical protein